MKTKIGSSQLGRHAPPAKGAQKLLPPLPRVPARLLREMERQLDRNLMFLRGIAVGRGAKPDEIHFPEMDLAAGE